MNVTAVESTALATVGYDDAHELLQLEFRSGANYRYYGVPTAVHEALLQAPSKGSYFNWAIRGRFPYTLLAKCNANVPDAEVPAECRG
jgi:hypothetical protein